MPSLTCCDFNITDTSVGLHDFQRIDHQELIQMNDQKHQIYVKVKELLYFRSTHRRAQPTGLLRLQCRLGFRPTHLTPLYVTKHLPCICNRGVIVCLNFSCSNNLQKISNVGLIDQTTACIARVMQEGGVVNPMTVLAEVV